MPAIPSFPWTADGVVTADSPFFTADGGFGFPPHDLWAAIQAVIQAGLVPIVVYQASAEYPPGFLMSQSPTGGTVVTPGTQSAKVFLIVSTGPTAATQTTVPNLSGLTVYLAGQALLAAGLSTGYTQWVTSASPEGTLVGQSIAAGTQVTPGTMVTMQVSRGPARSPLSATVPTVS